MGMNAYKLLACCVCLLVISGCGTILVRPFYPRTGAHGIVVDQFDHPVTNCEMTARWTPESLLFVFLPPQRSAHFQPDKDGRWRFYMRDADLMYIGIYRSTGAGTAECLAWIGSLRSGECPTNNVIFRLRVEGVGQPARNH